MAAAEAFPGEALPVPILVREGMPPTRIDASREHCYALEMLMTNRETLREEIRADACACEELAIGDEPIDGARLDELIQHATSLLDKAKRYRDGVEPEGDRALDRAYYNGARQAAAMAHQSLEAMDEWVNAGCGGRGPVVNRPAEPT